MNLGAHMSISGGVHRALERGLGIGCNAVQLFVKSTNQWRVREYTGEEIERFRELALRFRPGFILAHTSYLINLASPDPVRLARSRKGFLEEMRLAEILGIPYLVVHPGSHMGAGEEAGIRTAAGSLNHSLSRKHDYRLQILLETTAGQGHSMGHTFEQLARIIDLVEDSGRVGICLDTCHVFAAGYDLRNRRTYESLLSALDGTVGIEKLRGLHLNDSRKGLGSRVDRHTHIGKGMIGKPAFRLIVNDVRLLGIPMVLETPKGPGLPEDIENLTLLRSLRTKKTKRIIDRRMSR